MKYEKKYLHFISFILFLVLAFSVCFSQASAVYYEDTFPYSETGLTGGAYIECNSSIGNIVLILPYGYKDNFLTFTTNGNLFNASNNTINCALFLNGNQYTARFPSFGTLEYRAYNGDKYTYVDVTTGDITDTNVIFVTASERVNDNYYFSKFEIALLSVNIAILFFVFLGWFLWHRNQ